jgi:hypothetical protein
MRNGDSLTPEEARQILDMHQPRAEEHELIEVYGDTLLLMETMKGKHADELAELHEEACFHPGTPQGEAAKQKRAALIETICDEIRERINAEEEAGTLPSWVTDPIP